MDRLEENSAAVEVKLTKEEVEEVRKLVESTEVLGDRYTFIWLLLIMQVPGDDAGKFVCRYTVAKVGKKFKPFKCFQILQPLKFGFQKRS